MDDETLVRLFEAGETPPSGFHHRDHVRVAWWYLRQDSLAGALHRFTDRLLHFARLQGKPHLFHATITTAYMLIIHERLLVTAHDAPWEAFAAQHPDLLTWRPSALDRYYTPETLASERARQLFVMPDRLGQQLPAATGGQSETLSADR